MARAARICPKPGCPRVVNRRYCIEHEREYEAKRGTREQRGYDYSHRKTRATLDADVQRGSVACVFCGLVIQPDEAWHLDHTVDRSAYRGPAHATCNERDGGRRAHLNQ